MKRTDRTVKLRQAALGLGLLTGLCALGTFSGCYKRVVRTSGLGTQHTTVYEPNVLTDEERRKREEKARVDRMVETARRRAEDSVTR
ncbi:MAG: hypothetical protein SFZ24_09210 [Planctomycetota bacterium]|nr:hypothetical protein [Planctomycetota bacterium]